MGDDSYSIEEQFDVYDEMMSDYFDEMASSIFGPQWWAKPGRNLYMDLTTIQQVKFSRLVTLIKKKKLHLKIERLVAIHRYCLQRTTYAIRWQAVRDFKNVTAVADHDRIGRADFVRVEFHSVVGVLINDAL